MNQLKEVTFINSATLPFAQIDVGANTLFSGGNGAGKTTILRSILYFYGAGRSESLGISRKKKRFDEYYFASINSYLVYRFQNQDSDVLAIVYKAGGLRVKYRFAIERNKEEMKELFFEGNSALEPKDLWTRLLEKEYELSPVMNSPKEYKSVLYGQDQKLSQFSFFRANTEYEQISKTLSNVFINSKLDSGSIKKSLVSSISGFEPIDLNHMRRNIDDFRVKYDDISSFSKNAAAINEAVASLGLYEEQTKDLHTLAQRLGSNTKTGEEELNVLKEKTLTLSSELSALDKHRTSEEEVYQKEHDSALKEQGVLEEAISESKHKQAEYTALKIDEKLVLWDTKPFLEETLVTLKSQLHKLIDSQSSLSETFDALREKEMKSFHAKQQTLHQDIIKIQQDYNETNALYLNEKDEKLTHHRMQSEQKVQELSQKLLVAKEDAFSALSHEKITQYKSFDKEKIDKAKNENHNSIRAFDTEQANLQLLQSQVQKVAEQIFSAEQGKDYKLQNLRLKQDKEVGGLKESIEELIKKKDLNSASVLGYMRENNFENTAVLAALLKDEVLFSQTLSPTLSQSNNSLLGLNLDCSSLDIQGYDQSAIAISLQASQERLKRMNEVALVENEALENEVRNSINALRREQGRVNTLIDESLRVLPKLETQSLTNAEHLQSLQNLASKVKDEELSLAREQREAKDTHYKTMQVENEYLRKDLQDQAHFIINESLKKQKKLDDEKTLVLEHKNEEIVKIASERDKQFDSIKQEEDETLIRGGVDESLLKKYQDNIENKENELTKIEAFSKLIAVYNVDKERMFDTLEDKIKELETLSAKLKEKEKEQQLSMELFDKNKTSIVQERDGFVRQVSSIQKDLKEYLSFKDSTLYIQLSSYIENSELEASQDNVSDIINKLRDLGFEHSSSKDKLRKKLNKAFSSMSTNNIFSLYAPGSDTDRAILASAHGLKTFVLENKIQTYKEEVAKEFTMTLRHLSSEIGELLKAEGDISKTVSRINKTLQDLQGIKVIRGIELRYKESDNLLLNVLKAIGHLVEDNPYGNEVNLFSSKINESFNEKALKHLEELSLHLGEDKSDLLTLDESFVLEFRAIENGNDTGFVPSLDGIGSNGTDVMVKAMVNIAMLSLARKQSSKKDASVYFHCILDEVGILSPAYLKELIAYANNKQIRFINGAPDEKLVSTYKRLYMLSTDEKHRTVVRKLVSQS